MPAGESAGHRPHLTAPRETKRQVDGQHQHQRHGDEGEADEDPHLLKCRAAVAAAALHALAGVQDAVGELADAGADQRHPGDDVEALTDVVERAADARDLVAQFRLRADVDRDEDPEDRPHDDVGDEQDVEQAHGPRAEELPASSVHGASSDDAATVAHRPPAAKCVATPGDAVCRRRRRETCARHSGRRYEERPRGDADASPRPSPPRTRWRDEPARSAGAGRRDLGGGQTVADQASRPSRPGRRHLTAAFAPPRRPCRRCPVAAIPAR